MIRLSMSCNFEIGLNNNKTSSCRTFHNSNEVACQHICTTKYTTHKFCKSSRRTTRSKFPDYSIDIALEESETKLLTDMVGCNSHGAKLRPRNDSHRFRFVSLAVPVVELDRCKEQYWFQISYGEATNRDRFLTQLLRDLCCHEDSHGTHGTYYINVFPITIIIYLLSHSNIWELFSA